MKKIPFFLLLPIALFLASCGSTAPESNTPEDLDGKKALLKEKQMALQTLRDEIAQLEQEIAKLDPSSNKKTQLVTTLQLAKKTFNHYVEMQGVIQSDEVVTVSSETGGRLLEVKVIEGQNVSKGQLIARIDLDQLKKQIAEVETSLELAEEVHARQQRLWEQKIGSEIQLLQAKNNVDRLKKTLETLNFQLNKSNIYAPISGVVEMVSAKAGEMTGPGTPILMILNTSRVKVVADVPETYLRSVRKGETVSIKFPSINEEKQARVSLIGSFINASNRTFAVEAELPNPSGILKPNLLAIMLINDHSEKDAVVVPIELVQQEIGGKDYVFVKKDTPEGSIAQKVYVKTGLSYDGEIVITEGLKGDEVLIYEGARMVSDQDLVQVKQG
ncbi:MAG: efflux RND transporter periplasmic adaptor subunit [Saprospiraceae bacterium]